MASLGATELKQSSMLNLALWLTKYFVNMVNIMSADVLAPHVSRSAAALVLTIQDR